jgi:predicted Zn-dependent protease
MEFSMKSRILLLTAAFLMFGFAVLLGLAQVPGSGTGTSPGSAPGASPSGQSGTTPSTFPPASAPSTPAPAGQASSDNAAQTAPPETVVQPADPDKVKHNGGKDDVDAVGNRKIGGRGLGNWYSIETDIKMGKQYAQQVEASSKMINDPVITEYVNRLGQNLVRNSDAQVPFTFKVIDADAINAFSLPGGFVYINTGTILAADEEAELAGVMAHEIAHVCARHATRQMTRGQLANMATIPLIFVGGGIGYAVYEAAGLGLPMTFLAFQRGFEAEADYLGLQYQYKSGYDPQAFISFFEKIQAQEKRKPGTIAKAFATHPQTPDRIEVSQKEIATILPARPEYTVTTSEFDDVKARLASLENRRKVVDTKDANKPSLRRSNKTTKDGQDPESSPDDHPTLKRRDDSSN